MAFDYLTRSQITPDFRTAVAIGAIPGWSIARIHGESNGGAGTIRVPVWTRGNVTEFFPSAQEGLRMYTPDNTATQSLAIQAVTYAGVATTLSATLTGTTPVNLGTFEWVNDFYNVDTSGKYTGTLRDYVQIAGSGAIAAGTAGAGVNIYGEIVLPWGRQQWAHYKVPADKELVLLGGRSSINESSGVSGVAADFELWYAPPNQPMEMYQSLGQVNLGGNPAQFEFDVPIVIGSTYDVEIRVLCDSTGLDVHAAVSGLLRTL